MNASRIYDGPCFFDEEDEELDFENWEGCDYFIDEYWIASGEIPQIAGDDGTGIDALGTPLATSNQINMGIYSELSCGAAESCKAIVYNERIWDSVEPGVSGYRLES